MMTGQLVTDASPALTNAAAMMANHADVVHVQLLDRIIVVPTAVVNVSLYHILLCSTVADSAFSREAARAAAPTSRSLPPLLAGSATSKQNHLS